MRNVRLSAIAAVVIVSAGYALIGGGSFITNADPTPTPKSAYGLIKEGGFDKGLASWENAGGAPPAWDTKEGHSGKGAARFKHTVIQQRMVTGAETPVILKFWAKAASPTKINVYTMCSAEFWQEPVDVTGDWREYTFDITRTSLNQDDECVVFENETTVDVWLDDVVVAQGKQ